MLQREQYLAASRMFKLLFLKTMQSTEGQEVIKLAKMLAMFVPSEKRQLTYRWFLGVPKLREWIGERRARELESDGYEVRMKTYEGTLKVMRDDLEDDQLGGYRPAIMTLANEVKLLPWRRIVDLFSDGFDGEKYGMCFDGAPLFSIRHPTVSNASTALLSVQSLAD